MITARMMIKKRRRVKPLVLLVLIAVALAIFISFRLSSQKENLGSSAPGQSLGLKEAVEKALVGSTGTYGVAIKNLKTGESYYSNEHRLFEAGSLYKLWIMATAVHQIERGELKEDEILSGMAADLNREYGISPDSADLTEGRIILTVKQAMTQMIVISHNYSAFLLLKRVASSNVSALLKEQNFDESFLDNPPTTTAFDVATFFEKLYWGKLANQAGTEEMLNILKEQTLNEKLPKYLPEEVTVAHKTGEIRYFSHDAGIVFSSGGDYVIAVMSETDFPPGAEERIAGISQAVYQYFQVANRE